MVNFAINYSKEVKNLLLNNQIQPDLIKCPDWVELVSEANTIHDTYVHFDIKIGSNKFKNIDWEQVNYFLTITKTKFINTHLAFPKTNSIPQYISKIEEDLEYLCNRFGEGRIIIENPPLNRSKKSFQYCASQPKIFTDLINKFNCGFLFDISHAVRTAQIMNVNFHEQLEAFPLHKLVELHMTGLKWIDGENMDHYEMDEESWSIFDTTLKYLKNQKFPQPHIIAFEYGGFGPLFDFRSETEKIRQQVPIFKETIKKYYG